MIELVDISARGVGSRDGFARLVDALAQSRVREPEIWTNQSLEAYLEALAAWARDMDGYFMGRGEAPPAEPTWELFGQMLLAARTYE